MNSQVYKKWYVSFSEALFPLNLALLSGFALYTTSSSVAEQGWFTAMLVGIAIIQSVVIVVFNTVKYFLVICAKRSGYLLLANSSPDYYDLSFQRNVSDT